MLHHITRALIEAQDSRKVAKILLYSWASYILGESEHEIEDAGAAIGTTFYVDTMEVYVSMLLSALSDTASAARADAIDQVCRDMYALSEVFVDEVSELMEVEVA
jgi:hypothetical protein